MAKGRPPQAFHRSGQTRPQSSTALFARLEQANAFHRQGQLAQAEVLYREILAREPNNFNALHLLGVLERQRKHSAAAIELISRALKIDPRNAYAHSNLGNAYTDLNRHHDAIACYGRALAIKPDHIEALLNMATALAAQGKRREALDSYRKALTINPDCAEARWMHAMATLGSVAGPQENPAVLREEFSRALAELDSWFDSTRTDAWKLVGLAQPFDLAYQEENNRDLLSRYGALCTRLMKGWQDNQNFAAAASAPGGRIRVGIVSAQVHDHSVWVALVNGWLQHMNRERFELHVFHIGAKTTDEAAWVKSRSDGYEHGARALQQWVEVILGKHLHVLIYPEIGIDPMTAKLASLRLAPVQAVAWGHPETSGLPTMDYYLSAAALEPPGAEENYSERLVALPGLGCCYAPLPLTRAQPDFAALKLDTQVPLLLCPGAPFKYAPQHDALLIDIARRLGRCQFVFFVWERPELSEKLRQRLAFNFAQAGLDFAHYGVFVPWLDRPAFHGLMRHADVFLDTPGFSGFNTAIQAIACGLPIVTREGRFMRGRFASGLLRSMGMAELVAADEAGYVELAVRLASDTGYRQDMRRRMETSSAVLFNDIAAVRALEDFLIETIR